MCDKREMRLSLNLGGLRSGARAQAVSYMLTRGYDDPPNAPTGQEKRKGGAHRHATNAEKLATSVRAGKATMTEDDWQEDEYQKHEPEKWPRSRFGFLPMLMAHRFELPTAVCRGVPAALTAHAPTLPPGGGAMGGGRST